jgi:hypothetical protein
MHEFIAEIDRIVEDRDGYVTKEYEQSKSIFGMLAS